tara:strand:+ start:145 stop:369 length:225 start_codon:yes stop_codon:yes gene_type:complete
MIVTFIKLPLGFSSLDFVYLSLKKNPSALSYTERAARIQPFEKTDSFDWWPLFILFIAVSSSTRIRARINSGNG